MLSIFFVGLLGGIETLHTRCEINTEAALWEYSFCHFRFVNRGTASSWSLMIMVPGVTVFLVMSPFVTFSKLP
jgi:hypothetical protein